MATCPVCRCRTRTLLRVIRSWPCEMCGSILRLRLEAPHPALIALYSLIPFLRRVDVVQRAPAYCEGCGYNLAGITSGRCPECGLAAETPAAS